MTQDIKIRISQMDIHDRDAFAQLLNELLTDIDNKTYFLCENYDINMDTAERWISGYVAPVYELRQWILQSIESMVATQTAAGDTDQ